VENLLQKMGKALKYLAVKVTPVEIGYHTLILIGENGKIKHVRILKGLVIALILVQVLLFCAAVFVLYASRKHVVENRSLMEALDISQKNYLAMRDEKDILTARLVLAESIAKGERAGAVPAPQTRVKFSIDNFKLFNESKINTLNIQFDLKNAGTDNQFTGYTFVILKENNIDQNNWLSVPNVPLVSKRPSEINKGLRFSISGLKQVYLTTKIKSSLQRYKIATVFVFSVSGELLLEKDISVEIKTGGN